MPRQSDVYESLRTRILSGAHPPGNHLPEESLSESLGVSRTPVRAALRRLAEEGLVTVEPRRGAFVAEFTRADIDEVFDLRRMLERRAASRAATHRTDDQLAQLERLVEEMAELSAGTSETRLDDLHHNNRDFHELVLTAASSPRQYRIATALARTSLTLGSFFDYADDDIERSVEFHRLIAGAIGSGQADLAGELMAGHIGVAHHAFMSQRLGTAVELP